MTRQNTENLLLVGFPSNGLVGTFTTSYLIRHLKLEQVGEIDLEGIPPTLFVEKGEILSPIRIYHKNNLYAIISDLPMDPYTANDFSSSILDFSRKEKIKKLIFVSGMETVSKDSKKKKIYGLVTHKLLEEKLAKNNIQKFIAGSIFGTDAAILSTFRKSDIPALVLYTECHPFFPDPEAAVLAASSLAKILNVDLDTSEIRQRMERLRIQYRALMDETMKTLQQQKSQPKTQGAQAHIYR
ncbi:MAG: proteasome assembly chaperone family protein [Nitrosopumilaceae archaeon]|nr:proteasome assembly chaperone family protein [Nitrosopumilaceae archaeon]NIU00917.1 proteasome assembly chaperone family protein [Nitrosopumilaceae archaeon]NIU87370.1 proteasome assembly chaperone family protein [Nitrosopumilaceae archaeon]NIV65898.1 proteasome assembly chaperone family protein [Nitrosopumilaceae archaeon]NIX61519.1 proteasome assembly chaperone family protein [Nitrosopumilaceae archaeon]